jgi:hypothetical protein
MKTQPQQAPASAASESQLALLVTALEGAETTAATLAERLKIAIDLAATRAAALRLLSRRTYAVVILDQLMLDSDPEGAELIWKSAGLAIPVPLSFAVAGTGRVEREVRSALARRRRETQLATTAASAALDTELKNAVTGMLLESQLALQQNGVPPEIETRLRTLAEIAGRMRDRLANPSA